LRTPLLLFGWLLLAWVSPSRAQNPAVVRLDPAELSLEPGQTTSVLILIEVAEDVFGLEVRLSFDPSVVRIADANANVPGIQLIPGNFLDPDESFVVADQADNESGELVYALTLLAPAEPASGDGVIVSFDVRALDVGTSQLSLSVILASVNGLSLPVTAEGGRVVVGGDAPPEPSPTSQVVTGPVPGASTATPMGEEVSTTESATTPSTGATRSPRSTSTAPSLKVTDQVTDQVTRQATETPGGDPIGAEATAASPSGQSPSNTPEGDALVADLSSEITDPGSSQTTEETPSESVVGIGEGVEPLPSGDGSDTGDNPLFVGGLVLLALLLLAVALFFGRRVLARNK
jgi:hypothetical protein